MRKIMFWLFSMFLFVTLPAFAQRGNHGGGNHGGNGGGHAAHGGGQHSGGQRGGGEARGQRGEPHGQRGEARGERRERGRGERGEARGHFDGRRFDHDYFRGHWGDGNRFYWGRCNWWGPRFYVGSYFWFNDAYWTIVDPIPYDWYDDEVYVDWVDGYGYVLVNPLYPGVYFHVGVRF